MGAQRHGNTERRVGSASHEAPVDEAPRPTASVKLPRLHLLAQGEKSVFYRWTASSVEGIVSPSWRTVRGSFVRFGGTDQDDSEDNNREEEDSKRRDGCEGPEEARLGPTRPRR